MATKEPTNKNGKLAQIGQRPDGKKLGADQKTWGPKEPKGKGK